MSADTSPLELVAELHRRQGEMYAGGPVDPILELLAEDIVWHVPGKSPIAGDHRGVAQVVEGTAVLDGEQVSWQTIGVYRVDAEHRWISEVRLVPLNGELFDRIWGSRQAASGNQ